MSDLGQSLAAAAARVEAGDPDRFAATMAVPAAERARLWPLYAANLEIARAPWASSEPMVAEMRLQWWVDALEALAEEGHAPRHEIGAALVPLRAAAPHLMALAEARRRDCWNEPFADAAELSTYLAETSGTLFRAAGVVFGADAAAQAALARYGAAAGLAAWLRAVPELRARGRAPLPDTAPEAIAGLARAALAELAAARAELRRAPAPVRRAMLPGWQAPAVLGLAARAPGRVAQDGLGRSEFSRRFGLLRAALTI